MTKPKARTKETAAIVIHGEDESGKSRAAQFPADQIDLANKAAALMHLQLFKVTTPELADVAQKLPTGRIFSNGRGFVPYVRRELYARLIEAATGRKPHNAEVSVSKHSPTKLPENWDTIGVGDLVLALWDSAGGSGWWEAIVVGRTADMLTLRWRDHREPNEIRHRLTVALLDPASLTAADQPAVMPVDGHTGT